MKNRHLFILQKIVNYSDKIAAAIERFALDYQKFIDDTVVRDAICMSLLQIGELVNKLTEEFKQTHEDIEWHKVIALRHRVIHDYYSLDLALIWQVVTINIPELKTYCKKILEEIENV